MGESGEFCLPSCFYLKPAAMRHTCLSELEMARSIFTKVVGNVNKRFCAGL